MGELRTSLNNIATLVKNVEKSLSAQAAKLEGMSKDADEWRKSGFKAIDEFAIYMLEKLKKKNVQFKTVQNELVKDYSDANIARYLQGVQFCVQSACGFSDRIMEALGDRGFSNDLAGLDKALQDVAARIRKKKKKFLQSKKYKTKIAGYEATLGDLQTKVAGIKKTAADLREATPSAERIRQQLSITENSKLKDLIVALDFQKSKQYKDYNSLLLRLNETASDMRERLEFAGHMKVIHDMIDEAEAMEKE